MPLWTPPPYGQTLEQNARGGTLVTASGVDTKGTWTSIIAASAQASCGIWVSVSEMAVAATDSSGLLDIGVGPTDPPNIVIPDWNVGWCGVQAAANPSHSKMQFFPVWVPGGSKVWARLASKTSADTVMVKAALMEDVPAGFMQAEYVTAYGVTVTGSKGINATAGAGAGTYGTQVQLTAATSRDHRMWAVGIGGAADTTLATVDVLVQLLIGSGTTGPIGTWEFKAGTGEAIGGPFPPWPIYMPVPSGTRIDARVAAGANTDSFDVIAYGMG